METNLTIALVYHNEEVQLSSYLSSLPVSGEFQFLFIDNASTDKSFSIVENWKAMHPDLQVSHHKRKENHLGKARAQAVELCSTPWIAFLDADCRPLEGWGEQALKILKEINSDVAAIGGFSKYKGSHDLQAGALQLSRYFPWAHSQTKPKFVSHLPTNNLIMRVDAVKSVGNFSSRFARVGEDLELSCRLGRQFRILYYPRLRVDHLIGNHLWPWLKKMFYYGLAQPRAYLLHLDRFSVKKFIPLLATAGLVVGLILQPLLFLTLLAVILFPGLRMMFLSFIFYGVGELFGLMTFPIFLIFRTKRGESPMGFRSFFKISSSKNQ